MAVQIPTVQRIDAAPDASVGRIDAKIPDSTRAMEIQATGVEHLGKAAEAYFDKVETDAAHIESTKRALQYEATFKEQMYGTKDKLGAKFQEGDPTKIYNDVTETMKQRFQELTNDDSLSRKAKEMTLKALTEKSGQLEVHQLAEYGAQNAKYQDNVNSAARENEKNNLTTAAAVIKPEDPTSFAMFDQTVAKIRDLNLKNAIRVGTAVPDENGMSMYIGEDGKPTRLKVSEMASHDLKKDLSEGIFNAMDNAVKSGQLDVAKALKDKYGDYLDPVAKRKLTDGFEKEEKDQTAYKAAVDTRGMTPDQVEKYISKIPDPETQDKARKVINDNQARQEEMVKRASTQNANVIMNRLTKIQNSPNPILTETELMNDPVVKNALDKVTDAKQKKAIIEMVVQPKQTSDAARSKMQDLIFGNDADADIQGMSPSEFNGYLSGLSKADRNKYTRRYESMNSETGAQTATRYKASAKELQDQLIDVGYIKRDQFGKISGINEQRLIEARGELDDHLDKQGSSPMSPKDIKDYARNFAIAKKTGQAFQDPEPAQKFQGTKTETPPAPSGAIIKGKTRVQWNQKYLQDNKRPATKEQLDQYINGQE